MTRPTSSPRNRKHKPDEEAMISPNKAARGLELDKNDDPFALFALERVRQQQQQPPISAKSPERFPQGPPPPAAVAAPDLISWDEDIGVSVGAKTNPFDEANDPLTKPTTNPFDLM
ncbi:hypothetical protein AaE_004972 [Aphanomyces astaci]|uniref:Uncharacterized protein n=1 Tax=Aphanomyces astaci TaxID=112090 RepID=A0A6A5A3M2_APHAT|nr:hypothetical protein AaE_004972 [Aphanomyces astaci]